MTFNDLNEDVILYIVSFFENDEILKRNFYLNYEYIFLCPLEILFLKFTCKNWNQCLQKLNKKYRCNLHSFMIKTIYFNEISKIGNVKMFDEFNDNMPESYLDKILINACGYNNINVLEWYYNKNENFRNNYKGIHEIRIACRQGNIEILEWFREKNIFYYDNAAIGHAICCNHINVIHWFINHPEYEFKCDNHAIEFACENGNIEILELLLKHSDKIKKLITEPHSPDFIRVYNYSIKLACKKGHLQILEWFKNKFNATFCNYETIHFAAENNNIHILNWYKNNNFEIKFNPLIIKCCNENIQNWFNEYIIGQNM